MFAKCILLAVVLIALFGAFEAKKDPAPKPTPRPKPTPKVQKEKYACKVCRGEGNDCTPDAKQAPDQNCDFCAKITGNVEDPKKVPPLLMNVVDLAFPGTSKLLQQYKGKRVTLRKGAPAALVALSGQTYKDAGCTDFPDLMGMKNVTACLCDGDCADESPKK